MTAAALAGLWWAPPAAAVGGQELTVPLPHLAIRRYGVAAVWPRWSIAAETAGGGYPPQVGGQTADGGRPATGDKPPSPGLPRAVTAADARPVASAADSSLSPSSSQSATHSPGYLAPLPLGLSANRGPALRPELVERELARRAVQRLAEDDSMAPSAGRRELALRALTSWQLPGATPTSTDEPVRHIGLERWRIGSALALGASGTSGLEMVTVRSRSGEIRRQQLQIGGGKGSTFHLSLLDVARGFNRFQELSAEERSWAGAMSGMRRLDFGGDKIALAGGQSELGVLELAEGKAKARRMSLGFTGKRWTVSAFSQRIDDRFKRLGDLTEADRKTFGAERGIARDSLDLGYAFRKDAKLSASNLTLRAASGAAERHQIEYSGGTRLLLRYNVGRVDPKFDRIADLMEPDRNALAPQRGREWSDLTANLSPARWLTTENQWYQGTSLETGQRTTQLKNTWTLQLAPRSKLVLMRNLLAAPSGKAGRSRALTQSVRLEQWLTRTLFFTGVRETVQNALTGSPDSMMRRLALHVNTAPKMALQASADYSTAIGADGKADRLLQWSLGLPLRRGLALEAKGERHEVAGHPGAGGLSLGVTGQMARGWDLALSLHRANPGQGPSAQDLGIRLTFAGLRDSRLFRETRLVFGVGDTLGLPSAVPVIQRPARPPAPPAGNNAPRTPAPRAGGASSAPPGPPLVPARRLRSVALETKFRGQPIALGLCAAAGTVGGLTYHWATDPKRRMQIEALREVRDLGRTSLVARQRYAFRTSLGRTSQLSCSYEIQPELSPGTLLLGHAQTKAEAQTRLAGLAVTTNIAWDRDDGRSATTTLVGVSLAGDLDPQNSFRASYTGRSHGSDPAIPAHEVRLAFERKPDEALRVALGAEWRAWDGKRAEELAWQLDLTAVF